MPPLESRVAFFKVMPLSNIPHRKGPLQIIRCCQNCIRNVRKPLDNNLDEILNFMCYDDLIIRKSLWFSSYQTIQYQMGQFELLTEALQDDTKDTLFLVAQTNSSDVEYLSSALRHSILDDIRLDLIEPGAQLTTSRSEPFHYKTVPMLHQTCPTKNDIDPALLTPLQLEKLLKPLVDKAKDDWDFDIQIVLVMISKDHDKKMFPGLGTLCIQMLEPFSLQDYARNSLTSHPSSHLVAHICHNVSQSVALLAPNLVAFLLLFLERDTGVSLEDLTNHVEWFRNSSLDIGLHLGFTGETKSVVEFGLLVLQTSIHKSKGLYLAKDFDSLDKYAGPVTVSIAYQGIISRAILVEHNKATLSVDTAFNPDVHVRVARDDVISTSREIARNLEWFIACRKPCVDIETMVKQELSKMQLSGRYLLIQEPKINSTQSRTYWAGEEDSDEEYFAMNKDRDAFKTWIQLTTNADKLDRLNLFMNAVGWWFNDIK